MLVDTKVRLILDEPKKTVGSVALELMQQPQEEFNAVDFTQDDNGPLQEWEYNILQTVERGVKDHPHTDLYIIVINRRYRILENVTRCDFFYRLSCPTPDYDQTVYKYHHKSDDIEFLWVIPAQDACHYLKDNALNVAPEEKQLLQFVLDFADGTLFQIARILNGEIQANKSIN